VSLAWSEKVVEKRRWAIELSLCRLSATTIGNCFPTEETLGHSENGSDDDSMFPSCRLGSRGNFVELLGAELTVSGGGEVVWKDRGRQRQLKEASWFGCRKVRLCCTALNWGA